MFGPTVMASSKLMAVFSKNIRLALQIMFRIIKT